MSLRRASGVFFAACLVFLLSGCGTTPSESEEVVSSHPTVVVVTNEGPYNQSFDDADDWLVGQTETSVGVVENGEYIMRVLAPNQLAWTNQTRSFGDGVYEADVTFRGGSEGSGFGFLFLANSEMSRFFYAIITADGRYDVGFCERYCERQESLIDGYTLAPIILTGYQTNRLHLELNDGELIFIINGAAVSQFRGVEISEGVFGFFAETSPFGALEVAFDNLSIVENEPPEESP